MNKLDNLKDELSRVVSVANEFSVNHTDVAKENGISYEYARQMRNGEKPSKDNEDNCKLIHGLINSYRKEIRKKKRKLNSINVDEN